MLVGLGKYAKFDASHVILATAEVFISDQSLIWVQKS